MANDQNPEVVASISIAVDTQGRIHMKMPASENPGLCYQMLAAAKEKLLETRIRQALSEESKIERADVVDIGRFGRH